VKTKFIQATNGDGINYGKFMLARFDADEWDRRSHFAGHRSLIAQCGWSPDHLLVFDLQTGEGALFRPGGYAKADLDKHRVWVCILFEPFLEWLYTQDLSDLDALPDHVDLPHAPSGLYGYRRPGPDAARDEAANAATVWREQVDAARKASGAFRP
jgi:hypothetical protein